MKPRSFKSIGSISLSALLVASTIVIFNSNAYAEQDAVGAGVSSSSSDEVATASGSNRFVVWADTTPGNADIFFRRSTDNGATWQAIKNLSNNAGGSYNPEIAVYGSDVYVTWLQANSDGSLQDIFFRRSTDNGATWKSVVKITSGGFASSGASPQVIASGNNVYVVWDEFPEIQPADIKIRRSTDSGATWKPIFNISNNPGNSISEKIAVSGSNVYVVWYQESSDQTLDDVFFRRSTDNGATWKSKVNLSKSGQAYSGPEIAVSGSNIHVVWNQRVSSQLQVFIRSTTDGGAAWNSAQMLSDSSSEDFIHPRVDTSGSNVYVLYEEIVYEDDHDLITDILLSISRNSGATWEPAVILVANVFNSDSDSDPRLLSLGSNVYVTWREGDQSNGDLHFRGSTDNGVTWGAISGDLNNTKRRVLGLQIAAAGSNIYIVWGMNYPSEVFFLRSADNGATWKPVVNLSNSDSGRSFSPQIAV